MIFSLAPAHFPHKTKQISVVKGEQAHLQCSAYGDTPMEISWRMEGQHITADGDQRYSIREQILAGGMVSELGIERTLRQDTGIFSCFAANSYGHDEMNIQLTVQEIPEAPRNVRVNEQLSRSIGLSWSPPYAGNTQITSYIIQYKLGLGKLTTFLSETRLKLFFVRSLACSTFEGNGAGVAGLLGAPEPSRCSSLPYQNLSGEPLRA